MKSSDVTFSQAPSTSSTAGTAYGVITNNSAAKEVTRNVPSSSYNIPEFQMPGYRRPIMQVKRPDGKYVTMELRVTNGNFGYSNQIQPNQTNGGWLLNIMGKNLATLSLNGYFLDTKTNREAQDFMRNYKSYLTPRNTDKYFSSALTTIVYKSTEYKGLVVSLNVSDDSQQPLNQRFTMQFLILKEKDLTSSQMSNQYLSKTIARNGLSEPAFLSDLNNLLANPITGVTAGN